MKQFIYLADAFTRKLAEQLKVKVSPKSNLVFSTFMLQYLERNTNEKFWIQIDILI